ncbi:MAG TPA: glycosyltransferase family 2 protein [Pirellulales bacterium]|nr:glycosyltransferase family 2 protein [Pirellulales bacterium]
MTPSTSLTMIGRDAEASLARALATTADLVDEIVFVDTGSTDRTCELAAAARDRHGRQARVFPFIWCDDFSAARNESLRQATGEWVFWMDCDDWLDEPDRQALAKLIAGLDDEHVVYQMLHVSPAASDGGHPASTAIQDRLFRNLPEVRWQGRVHEQIVPAVLRSGGTVRTTSIAIQHTGYDDAAERRRKVERNLRLLELENAERPDNGHTLFYLGMTCGMAGRPAEAIVYLERSLAILSPRSRLRPRLYLLLADCCRLAGDAARARATCREGLAAFPGDADLARLQQDLRGEPPSFRVPGWLALLVGAGRARM